MTSMSLLLSSASASGGNEPGWSSLLKEICPCIGVQTDIHTGCGSAPQGNEEPGKYSKGQQEEQSEEQRRKERKGKVQCAGYKSDKWLGKGKTDRRVDRKKRKAGEENIGEELITQKKQKIRKEKGRRINSTACKVRW